MFQQITKKVLFFYSWVTNIMLKTIQRVSKNIQFNFAKVVQECSIHAIELKQLSKKSSSNQKKKKNWSYRIAKQYRKLHNFITICVKSTDDVNLHFYHCLKKKMKTFFSNLFAPQEDIWIKSWAFTFVTQFSGILCCFHKLCIKYNAKRSTSKHCGFIPNKLETEVKCFECRIQSL